MKLIAVIFAVLCSGWVIQFLSTGCVTLSTGGHGKFGSRFGGYESLCGLPAMVFAAVLAASALGIAYLAFFSKRK